MSASLSASFFVYKERKRITDLHLSYTEGCLALSPGGKPAPLPLHYSRVQPQGPCAAIAGVEALFSPFPAAGIKFKELGLRVQATCVIVDLWDLREAEEAQKNVSALLHLPATTTRSLRSIHL